MQTLIDNLLSEQRQITAVERLAHRKREPDSNGIHRDLIPLSRPGENEQYAFEVDLDICSGCKSCVVACHTLNGLDENESWRKVGALSGRTTPDHQFVTTSCHHCQDPACLNGCPTRAYEKDADTGIVRHLDDQCIGCRYCELKCPYEVPQYNDRLGIVRKCDMCHGRLAEGEAPACVQACPNEAIRIRIVSREEIGSEASPEIRLLPGTVTSDYTEPATRFRHRSPLTAAPEASPRPAENHAPLVWMLALTQAGVGLLTALLISGGDTPREHLAAVTTGVLLFFAGLGGSVAHLGQPRKAWKAFLGWRTSWLSREILAFGAVAGFAAIWLAGLWFPFLPSPLVSAAAAGTVLSGWAAVWTSVMVYADTRRPFWATGLNAARFLGTMLGAGLVFSPLPVLAVIPVLAVCGLDLLLASGRLSGLEIPSRLLREHLSGTLLFRCLTGLLACFFVTLPFLFLPLFLLSELTARTLFFRAVEQPGMPGVPRPT